MEVESENHHELRTRIFKIIKDKTDLDDIQCKDLEIGIFNWSLIFAEKHNINKNWNENKFRQIYINKSRSVVANIDKNSYIKNEKLLERLEQGEFVPHEIPFMDPINLFPEKWKSIVEKKLKLEDTIVNNKEEANTDQFKCPACKSRRIYISQLQTRSADEAMTLFLRCLDCSKNWKIG